LALALSAALIGSALVSPAARADVKQAYVQGRRADLDFSLVGSVSLDFRRSNRPGNLIVVFVVWDNGGGVSLSDSSGNTYAPAVDPTQTGGDSPLSAQIFYAGDIKGGANNVTVTFADPIDKHASIYIHEYTGIGRLVPFDSAVAASGTSAEMTSAALQTRSSSELLFVGVASDGRSIKRLTPGYHVRGLRPGELTADAFSGPASSLAVPYSATATQSGTGWTMQLAAFQYIGATPSTPEYPVGLGPVVGGVSSRYLVDHGGTPFLITGDSPQSLFVNLSESQANAFFANRRKRGFNTLWINLLCADYSGGRADASTYDGIRPFTSDFDISTPNEAYFSRVDDMIRLAARRGITVLLDPAETGSFLQVLEDNGADAARAYGRYLGSRYQGFDNIIWMSGNDFHLNQLPTPEEDAVVQAVALGIQDVDKHHIHTVELNFTLSGSLDDPSWAPIIQLNASYTYFPTYAQVLKDYDRNAMPTFLVEANYELDNRQEDGEPRSIRKQAYWTLLSGATGQMYGNGYTWPFLAGWKSHYDTPSAKQMGYAKRLFESVYWYELVPDKDHKVVTAGFGEFSDSARVSENDYVTAARTPDGSLVMAYLPTNAPITVDMTQLSGPANASWYDPSRGRFQRIAGSPLPNTDTMMTFTPPGLNHDKDTDWVLVLEVN
jgi:hypothetical protein